MAVAGDELAECWSDTKPRPLEIGRSYVRIRDAPRLHEWQRCGQDGSRNMLR